MKLIAQNALFTVSLPRFGSLAQAHNRAKQRRELQKLPAHLLQDIGLTPEAVAEEVKKPFWM